MRQAMNDTVTANKIIGTVLTDSYYKDDIAVFIFEDCNIQNKKNEYLIKVYCHFRITDLKARKLVVGIMAYAGLHNDLTDVYDSNQVNNYLKTLAKSKSTVADYFITDYDDLCLTFSNNHRLEVFSATLGGIKTWDIEERSIG